MLLELSKQVNRIPKDTPSQYISCGASDYNADCSSNRDGDRSSNQLRQSRGEPAAGISSPVGLPQGACTPGPKDRGNPEHKRPARVASSCWLVEHGSRTTSIMDGPGRN